ncbi:DUF4238 domain-containing protein [Actinacidiphila bryophytorum]|uniref:DUF4238 domain-containing protein n=1 Tax=Actinacidiphila bryophytorum TaxID=1436133 RepID=UPI002176A21C|nr:DUF4238 domain-containing protein [Actinacidiphila bryophytorum]UWE10190.1 DUF4238 domain-containing protein [Actinacidiphila bryophytorum]
MKLALNQEWVVGNQIAGGGFGTVFEAEIVDGDKAAVNLKGEFMSSGAKQHYVPAALIGGFGKKSDHKRLRDAVVCWRRREWAETLETSAEAIGWRVGMYRLQNPAEDLDPDVVDAVWKVIEPGISEAVRRFEDGMNTASEREWLVVYACMAGVRHPEFEPAINRWLAEQGKPGVSGDDVHRVRLEALENGLVPMRKWCWRILHSPPEAPRFTINDRAWSYLPQLRSTAQGRRALYLPLSSRVAAVGWLGQSTGGLDHQTLRTNWVRWLNAVTWTTAPTFIAGHPDEANALNVERTTNEVEKAMTLRIGSFQGITGKYLFDEVSEDAGLN